MKLQLPNPALLPQYILVLLVRPASQESIRPPARQSPVFGVVNWDTKLDSASRLMLPNPPLLSTVRIFRYLTATQTIRRLKSTCLAHQRSPQKKPKHEAAAKVLQKIDNMMEKGKPLNEPQLSVHMTLQFWRLRVPCPRVIHLTRCVLLGRIPNQNF